VRVLVWIWFWVLIIYEVNSHDVSRALAARETPKRFGFGWRGRGSVSGDPPPGFETRNQTDFYDRKFFARRFTILILNSEVFERPAAVRVGGKKKKPRWTNNAAFSS
jgi:hypothetical protein